MVEEWKGVTIEQNGIFYDFSELYEVSNTGKVRSLRSNILLTQHPTHNGYLRVTLYNKGIRLHCRVNRLVAYAFIPIPEGADVNKLDSNHCNEEKTLNTVENLSWCTRQENINYGSANERRAKTLGKKVRCVDTGIVYDSIKDAHEETGCSLSGISKCCHGKQEATKGLHFEFVEEN